MKLCVNCGERSATTRPDQLCQVCFAAAYAVEEALKPRVATWSANVGWQGDPDTISKIKSQMPSYNAWGEDDE